MPLIDFQIHPYYRDFWEQCNRGNTPADMFKYLQKALVAQPTTYPSKEERETEVTKKFPDPVLPPEIIPDDVNAETYVRLKVLNDVGQTWFPHSPYFTFRIKRNVQILPTYVKIRSDGYMNFYNLKDIGFRRAFKREIKEQINDPHVQLFLSLGMSKWIGMDWSDPTVASPLNKIGRFFSRIYDPISNSVDPYLNKVQKAINFVSDPVIKNISPLVTAIGNRIGTIEATLVPDFKQLEKKFYDYTNAFVTNFNNILIFYNQTLDGYVKMQQDTAKAMSRPLDELDEHFTVPLRTMKGTLDLRVGAVANYLALFGINEGKKVQNYATGQFNNITSWITTIQSDLSRYIAQVQTNIEEFKNVLFKPVQKTLDRITPIVDATIELLTLGDPETAMIRKEAWGRSTGAYPATTVKLLEDGVSESLPMKVTYPAPVENTLPEIQNASYMIDRIMENLYLGTDGKPINEAVGRDFVMTTDPGKIRGKVIKVEDVYNHPDLGTFDDLACNMAFGSAAQDEGSILDTTWSIVSDIPIGVMSLAALRLCRLPYKYLLFPAVFEYTLQAVNFVVREPVDYQDKLDKFNADFWNRIVQWTERSDQLEPWLPTP